MKTRLLIIIISIGIAVGSVSILYVVQIPHYSLEIQGMKDVYNVEEEYSFYYTLSGFGHTCRSWIVSYPDHNGEIKKAGEAIDCTQPTNKELSYDSRKDSRMFTSQVPKIEGKYNVTVLLENFEPVIHEFMVVSDLQNDYELDEALCMGGRGFIVNDECERIGKYNLTTGLPIVENKEQCDMLDGTWDKKQNTCDSQYVKENEDIFTQPMKNAIFDEFAGHYDYLPINNNPNMMAMEKIKLQDDNSINVEFGQNNYEWSTGYKPIPEFEYHANFKVNDTFVVLCTNIGKDGYADFHPDLTEPYLPGLGIVKYLGPITIENESILLFWHESATIPVDMSCSYPEIIHHSINLWELQENGLPTDSLTNALGSNYQN